MFNKQHDLKSDLHSPLLGRKNLELHNLTMRQYTETSKKKLSQNILILSKVVPFLYSAVPFFILRVHLPRNTGKVSSYDILHILNVSLGTSKTQHAINFLKEHIEEKKIDSVYFLLNSE